LKHNFFAFNIIIFTFLFSLSFHLNSQNDKNIVEYYSTPETFKNYLKNIKNDSRVLQNALKEKEIKKYLSNAKQEEDIIKIANGYHLLSELFTNSNTALKYADSIIQVSKNLDHYKYPGYGYFLKGLELYYASDYKEAFDYYLKANSCVNKNKNDFLSLRVKHSIGVLKSITNENEDALKYFKENLAFFKTEDNKLKYKSQYLKALTGLADSYNRNKKPDSSIIIVKKGIKECKTFKNDRFYPHFLMFYGFSKKEKKEFQDAAIDSVKKGLILINKTKQKKNVAKAYIVISEIYTGQKKHDNALKYLKKVDSMYAKTPDLLTIQALEANSLLNKYYTLFKNDKERLKTIDRIIKLDSIINIDKGFKYLNTDIIKKYDIPLMLKDRDKIIKRLQEENKKTNQFLFILLAIVTVLIIVVFYFLYRNRLNKKRFDNLLAKQNQTTNNTTVPINIKAKKTLPKGLSEELIEGILEKLQSFENSKKYTTTNYTLNSLAKELNTNSAYLSKIINTYKKVNFSNYLNGLRIDNVIERLTTDKILRSYTINAISEEAGFNNVQSFSVAFHKNTGIYPSYFIKQLKNESA